MVSSPPPFITDYWTSKTGSWAIFNKICQNDLTCYCHNGIINLLFSKFKKLKLGGGQDAQATVSSPPGVKMIRAGVKIPREILTPWGQAAHGYLDPRGSSCPGVKINRYTGLKILQAGDIFCIVTPPINNALFTLAFLSRIGKLLVCS